LVQSSLRALGRLRKNAMRPLLFAAAIPNG